MNPRHPLTAACCFAATVLSANALAGDELVGTLTLLLDCPPNQPHRAEVRKLMVHPVPVTSFGELVGRAAIGPLGPPGRVLAGRKTSRLIAIYISRLLSSLVICPRNSYLWPRSPRWPATGQAQLDSPGRPPGAAHRPAPARSRPWVSGRGRQARMTSR